MNNYKKVVLLSLVFAAVFTFAGKLIGKEEKVSIPDPEIHLRQVVEYLKADDLKYFRGMILPAEKMKKMSALELGNFLAGSVGGDESIGRLIHASINELDEVFWKEYNESFIKEFKSARDDMKDPEKLEWVSATWKLVGNSENPYQFRCNAKIYVKCGSRNYCIKYKNFVFYANQWFAGNFTDVDDISDPEELLFPDMYRAPSVEEYIYDSYKETEFPNDGFPAEDAASEESPSEIMEEG